MTQIEVIGSDTARATGDEAAVADAVAGMHALGGRLYEAVAAGTGNAVLSPYSVAVALGMTLAGARGETASQIRAVLGADDVHPGLNALTAYVDGLAREPNDNGDEVQLRTANQLFGQAGVAWLPELLDLLAREYGAGMRGVDFAAAEAARALINSWVAERTNDKIPALVPAGAIHADTSLVLVNALYLKATWARRFGEGATRKERFERPDGTHVKVPMMRNASLRGALARGDGWRAARLPYAGGRLAMTILLPDPGQLAAVEELVIGGGLSAVLTEMDDAMLDVRLPRWTFRTQAALDPVLKQLGMPAAFDPARADFTGLAGPGLDFFVGAVLHEGFIAVDENGTEAAAATAVMIRMTAMPMAGETFHVDRPFLFAIHDVERGTPLFLGRVTDPTT